jgi:2-desacetyl-2-hydroxyethyl bacteriochlorophyllide A dehydrogenase
MSERSRRLVLRGPRDLGFVDDDFRTVGPRDVRLRALRTGISHGTELNLYRGTAPTLSSRFDLGLRAYVERPPEQVAYPVNLGYEMVAEVVERGADVTEVDVGDSVHIGLPHQEAAVVDMDDALRLGYPLIRIPSSVSADEAIFISLASVALVGVHDSGVKVGDDVVVTGMGTIGLLCVQLLKLGGARRVIAVDPVGRRRELAALVGADVALDPLPDPERAGVRVKRMLGRGVDIAIESSASSSALHECITAVGIGGRIVTLSYYQGPATGLRLGEEWHINRPEMVSSMGLWNCPHRKAPAWDRERVTDTVMQLLASKRLKVEPLLSHTWHFSEAPEAFAAVDRGSDDLVRAALRYGDG